MEENGIEGIYIGRGEETGKESKVEAAGVEGLDWEKNRKMQLSRAATCITSNLSIKIPAVDCLLAPTWVAHTTYGTYVCVQLEFRVVETKEAFGTAPCG